MIASPPRFGNTAEELVAEREARFQVLDRIRSKLPAFPEEEVEQDVSRAIDLLRKPGA